MLIYLIAAVAAILLIGCGSAKKGSSADSAPETKSLVGYYELGWTEGDSVQEADVKAVKEAGIEFSLTVNEDGTARLVSNGKEIDLTYDMDQMIMEYNGGKIPFTFENDTIYLEEDGRHLTFNRED